MSIDDFEILKELGEGTFAKVFLAREINSGYIIAIKKMKIETEEQLEMFNKEYLILVNLRYACLLI